MGGLTQSNHPRLPVSPQSVSGSSPGLHPDQESHPKSLLPSAHARPHCPSSPHFSPRHGAVFVASGLKISDSEEKGSAVALKRKFLLGQPNTFLCGWIKANYLLKRRGPKEEAQPTLSQPFRTPSPPRPTFPAT